MPLVLSHSECHREWLQVKDYYVDEHPVNHLGRELVEKAGKQDIAGEGQRRRRFEVADASQCPRLVPLAQQRSTVVEVLEDTESKWKQMRWEMRQTQRYRIRKLNATELPV